MIETIRVLDEALARRERYEQELLATIVQQIDRRKSLDRQMASLGMSRN